MPHNFKLQGDYYVSKFGNDSWNGLTPDTPKRTIQAALNLVTSGTKTVIVGAGMYTETINRTLGSFVRLNLYGDGNVVINGLNTYNFTILAGDATNNFQNITFSNIPQILLQTNSGGTSSFTDCKIINTNVDTSTTTSMVLSFTRCILVSININNELANSSTSINYCVLVNFNNGPARGINMLLNSSINTSLIKTLSSITTGNLNYNNFQNSSVLMNIASTVTTGVIQDTYGRYYDLSIATSTGDGTVGNPYGRPYTLGAAFNFTNHRIAYPTYNVNSFSADPQFNDILSQDFTLKSTSPHIARASDFVSNIGGTQVALRFAATSSAFSGSGVIVDSGLTFSYDNYVISGSSVTGSLTSAPIFLSSSAKVIQEIDYSGLLAFNKDTGSFFSSGSNINVPDFDTYTSASGNPGANPDRLVYYMRHTTGSTQPVTDSDWDNGNLWTRGEYRVFEWNTKPSIDVVGRTNGDPLFLSTNFSFIRATYVQLQVKLRNNYLL